MKENIFRMTPESPKNNRGDEKNKKGKTKRKAKSMWSRGSFLGYLNVCSYRPQFLDYIHGLKNEEVQWKIRCTKP